MLPPLLQQIEEFYNNLLEGKSGITEISNFDASQLPTRFAGEIKVRLGTVCLVCNQCTFQFVVLLSDLA